MTVANGAPDPGLFRQCAAAEESAQVECQGMTVRQRPDVSVAGDEEILRLSDPPYYSAWPNPFLAEFRRELEPRRRRVGLDVEHTDLCLCDSRTIHLPVWQKHPCQSTHCISGGRSRSARTRTSI